MKKLHKLTLAILLAGSMALVGCGGQNDYLPNINAENSTEGLPGHQQTNQNPGNAFGSEYNNESTMDDLETRDININWGTWDVYLDNMPEGRAIGTQESEIDRLINEQIAAEQALPTVAPIFIPDHEIPNVPQSVGQYERLTIYITHLREQLPRFDDPNERIYGRNGVLMNEDMRITERSRLVRMLEYYENQLRELAPQSPLIYAPIVEIDPSQAGRNDPRWTIGRHDFSQPGVFEAFYPLYYNDLLAELGTESCICPPSARVSISHNGVNTSVCPDRMANYFEVVNIWRDWMGLN